MLSAIAHAGLIIFVVDWVIRIALLIYVPRGRKPSAAMAWLLAIFILPTILSVVLFLLIGNTKLSKRRRERQKIVDRYIDAAVRDDPTDVFGHLGEAERARYLPLAVQNRNLSKLPPTDGNAVHILADYRTTLEDMIQRIDSAEAYVYAEYFIISLDPQTQGLFDALDRAVLRGVDVRVMFDPVGSHAYRNYSKMKHELTRTGVKWRAMLPIRMFSKEYNRPDLRNHRKILVIDNLVAYVGSLNLIQDNYEARRTIVYEELTVRLTGPIVWHCAGVFVGDWYSETGEKLGDRPPAASRTEIRGTIAQLLPSGSAYEYQNNLKLFVALMYVAKRRVVITNPYFVPDDALLIAVTSAVQRGVEVLIINSAIMEQWMVGHAQRSYYLQLLEAGIKIYLHDEPVMLHSKHITIDDDIAVIGSSNMDIRSFELNLECIVVAYDPAVVEQLVKVQNQNMARCQRITLEAWRKRPLYEDFLDSIARLTAELQ